MRAMQLEGEEAGMGEGRLSAAADETGEERMVLGPSIMDSAVPSRVLIAPWGRVVSARAMFVVDEESVRMVLETFARHGTDVPVDYEHQSLGGVYASPSGQAPAAGWVRSLHAVRQGEGEAGLYGDVDWTEGGRTRLSAREYRYLSPVVVVRKSDRRVTALHSVALTNKPAIAGMRPIVNREALMAEENLDVLHEEQEITSGSEVLDALRLRLGMPEGSDVQAVLVAAGARLESMQLEQCRREAGERVAAAFRAGKLSGAQQEWAMRLAESDPECFDAWLATAPALVSTGRTAAPEVGTGHGRDQAAVAASARAAYRSHPELALLTSEEAWVEDALREAEKESGGDWLHSKGRAAAPA